MDNPPPYNAAFEKSQYPPPQAPYPQAPQYPPGQQYPQGQQQYPPAQQQYPPAHQQYPPAQQQYPPAQQYLQGQQYPQGGGQQQYPPPVMSQPVTTTNVIVQTGGRAGGLGPNPASMQCPHCHAQIVTTTETSAGSHAWLVVLIVTLVACVVFPIALLGCCFIPLCIPELRDVEHSCPNCRKEVGKYTRKF